MPNIKGIDLSDGVKILAGEVNTQDQKFSEADFVNYLATHTIEQTETQANNFLANACPGEQVRVHIFSASPLKVTCIVANADVVIPDNWWESGA